MLNEKMALEGKRWMLSSHKRGFSIDHDIVTMISSQAMSSEFRTLRPIARFALHLDFELVQNFVNHAINVKGIRL